MSLHARALRASIGLGLLLVAGAALVLINVSVQRSYEATADRATALLANADRLDAAVASEQMSLNAYARTRGDRFISSYYWSRQSASLPERAIRNAPARDPWTDRLGPDLLAAADTWQTWADAQVEAIQAAPPGGVAVDPSGDDLYATFRAESLSFHSAAETHQRVAVEQGDRAGLALDVIVGLAAVLGAAGLLILTHLLLRGALRPIGRLSAVAAALAAGERVSIPELERDDEIGSLARALATWDRSVLERLAVSQAMVEVGGEIDLRQVLGSGAKKLIELLSATMVGFQVQDRFGRDQLWLHLDGLGLRDPVPAGSRVPERSPSREAIRSRAVVIGDMRARTWAGPVTRWARERELGPVMAAPMVSGGDALGVVVLMRHESRPAFTQEDVRTAEILVPSLAAAVNVSRLFSALREANRELAEASRHKSEFLATMSHELRTPLNSILGFSQLLASSGFGSLSERQARYVRHINSSGEHLLALINDVLDISKVEAGQLELQPEDLPLRQVLEDCVTRLQLQAEAKKVELRLTRCGELAVRADGRRLRQVVLNLLSNAIKFTPEAGHVHVSARNGGGLVRIVVSDTGIGIPRQELGRIFERFTQVASGRTRNQEGTGLGLALSRRLAELMGGSIAVESREGRGSTFTVSLPVAAGARSAEIPFEVPA